MRIPRCASLLLVLALCGLAPRAVLAASRTELRVFAAASLTDVFTELAHTFEARHPGLAVQLNFAGSQQLVAQLEQGAGADVLASADERTMEYARDHGLIAGASRPFARNRLVLIVPKSNPGHIGRLQDLQRTGIKFVTAIAGVPVGHYTREVLSNLSHVNGFDANYRERVLANVVSEEENVKAIVAKVQLGEADAGFVYRSDVTPAVAKVVRMIEIPDDANAIALYPIAVLAHASRPPDAQAFVDLVLSKEGQRALATRGFMPVSAVAP